MVQSLHLRGYQRLRICPGLSASGGNWRCAITPAANTRPAHGARLARDGGDRVAHYSAASELDYFGWEDARHADPDQLAVKFIARFAVIAEAARGSDWPYAGWYVEMLHRTYPSALPIAYADWDLPSDCMIAIGGAEKIQIPFPPIHQP
jgi:hypothetical protein